ncbi:DB domain-containing protein [Aphelenchoides besseyi]|nr:DB domain-containing protein [Aphelenchoides besseyi]
MKPRTWVSIFALILPSIVLADLPSCYRARCSHCAIQFIAQMCPTTCGNCPQTFGRIPGQVHSLGQTDGQTQSAYGPQQTAQHGIYQAPSPQQQQVDNQTPHIQQPNNNLPQTYNPPPTAQQYNQQFSQTVQLPSSAQFPQMQPFGGFPSQMNGSPFPGFAQPQTANANTAQSGLFNPFQPFLHNSFQAQQPAQQVEAQQPGTYNPFTFPTFAPFTHAPMTLPTGAATFPTFAPFPTLAPATQAPLPQAAYQIPQQPEQTNYNTQQRIVQPQIQTENYAQNGQNGELQRPRQVYNPQQQIPAQNVGYAAQQFVNPPPQPASYLQPARANAIATVPVDQQARSIDSTPVQLEKQAFIGAGARCPKQPNWEPCITKELANERFRNCCQRLGEGCSQLCNYDQPLTTLQLSVLTGRCPIAKVADMMVCASGYEDATPCCTAYGVFEPGFEHCRPYCNPAAGLPNDGMLAEKYKCLGKLSQIQRCFYVSQRP